MKITHPLVVFSFAGLLTLSTVSAAALSAFQNFQQTDRIARGINAGGTDLSGLSKTEAIETIKRTAKNKLNKNAVLLSYQKQAWSIAPNEIDLQVYPEKTVDDAIAICRSGNLQQDLTDAFNCLVQKKSEWSHPRTPSPNRKGWSARAPCGSNREKREVREARTPRRERRIP